jgi:hypothetical protein
MIIIHFSPYSHQVKELSVKQLRVILHLILFEIQLEGLPAATKLSILHEMLRAQHNKRLAIILSKSRISEITFRLFECEHVSLHLTFLFFELL